MSVFLLSTLAASDFGFIAPGELLRRLDVSLASMARRGRTTRGAR
jgi:hypothetical protein